jgi:hypothetical protein
MKTKKSTLSHKLQSVALFAAFIYAFIWMASNSMNASARHSEMSLAGYSSGAPSTLTFATLLPDGKNNYSSRQLTATELDSLIELKFIGTVIRLNGNGKDAGALSIEEESAICKARSVKFTQVNAHLGYEKGKGYVESGELVSSILEEGNVLIHCKHGMDRTGAMVAYYLRKNGFDTETILATNGWENYLKLRAGDYAKYYESVKQ